MENQEIIIQQSNLFDIIDGLCEIAEGIAQIQDKIDEPESKKIMIPMVATLLAIIKLFPKDRKRELVELIEKNLDIDLSKIMG